MLEAAEELIAHDGATVSLEQVARAAGVGSATLHRHFPSRWSLFEAIFKTRAEHIAERSRELSAEDRADALQVWFTELISMAISTAGLAAIIGSITPDEPHDDVSCRQMIAAAGDQLLIAAQAAGRVRPDLKIDELIALAMAISTLPNPDARDRAFRLILAGWQVGHDCSKER